MGDAVPSPRGRWAGLRGTGSPESEAGGRDPRPGSPGLWPPWSRAPDKPAIPPGGRPSSPHRRRPVRWPLPGTQAAEEAGGEAVGRGGEGREEGGHPSAWSPEVIATDYRMQMSRHHRHGVSLAFLPGWPAGGSSDKGISTLTCSDDAGRPRGLGTAGRGGRRRKPNTCPSRRCLRHRREAAAFVRRPLHQERSSPN